MQGGTKHFEYPKYVWSPAGGWWCNPRHWKRNTAIAFVISGALTGVMWYISAQLEVRTCYSRVIHLISAGTNIRQLLHGAQDYISQTRLQVGVRVPACEKFKG